MICTFFGHRDAPREVKESLKEAITVLIKNKNVNMFYIGNNGAFDRMARDVLKEIKSKYNIKYYVALAYLPKKNEYSDYGDTIYFDELNAVPYKFRIIERNKIMLKKADYVVTYAKHIGNARILRELAQKQGKIIIDLI